MGEEGRVTLQLQVSAAGVVTDARVTKSSGFPRLDDAARRALSLCRFDPATVDGQPVASTHSMSYLWEVARE